MIQPFSMAMITAAIFAVGPITHAAPPQITPGTRLVCPVELGNTCFVFGGSYLPDYDRAKTQIEAQDRESYDWNFRKGCDHKILPYIHPGEKCYGLWVKAQPMPGLTADTLNESIRQADIDFCRKKVLDGKKKNGDEAVDDFIRCFQQTTRQRDVASRPPYLIDYDL